MLNVTVEGTKISVKEGTALEELQKDFKTRGTQLFCLLIRERSLESFTIRLMKTVISGL